MTNPLLAPSTLPFQLPDYATITEANFREALETGMTEHLAELDALAADPEPATVENVLHAWERSGGTLTRALHAFWVAKSADTNDERDAISRVADRMPIDAEAPDISKVEADADAIIWLNMRSSTMDTMERHRGHFFNWYDTRTLRPLLPLYISSVDSGNLAAALMCAEVKLSSLGHKETAARFGALAAAYAKQRQ